MSSLLAGMPSPLPTDVDTVLMLNSTAVQRLQVISFFLLGFLLSAAGLAAAWHLLRRDFPALPRLGYPRALLAVFLLGVLFIVVLTMISGARELMTPGAWVRQGATYKLADGAKPDEGSEASRRQALEKLRTALWQFAATHNGKFPTEAERNVVPADLWIVPGTAGMTFAYVPGRTAGHLPQPLAYEPDIDTGPRLVLRANGDIASVTAGELRTALAEK